MRRNDGSGDVTVAPAKTATRKATNVSLGRELLDEARALRVNLSRACEKGLEAEVATERARLWREENAEAIASANAYVERHGLPLARYRQF